MSTVPTFGAELMEFPVHFLTATIGGALLSILLTLATALGVGAFGIRLPDIGPTSNPLVWLAGLLLGVLMNRSRRDRLACFVGVLGVVLLFFLMLWDVSVIKHSPGFSSRIGGHYWQYEYDHMLSPHNQNADGEEYLGKFLFATPAVSSVAYSIGAWLAVRYSRVKAPPDEPTKSDTTAHMPKLRIDSRGSQLAMWQANHISAPLRTSRHDWTRTTWPILERNFSRFEQIRKICCREGSTLVLLKWGFGEYYQCGYWAALENRGSRLFAAARGSNPLLSAVLRDPRDVKTCLICRWFLTSTSPDGTLKLVLKRGTVAISQGGLTGRLSLLSNILPRVAHHA